MRMKGGGRGESLVGLGQKLKTLNCLQANRSIFIASIYMESRKVLKRECESSAAYVMANMNIQKRKLCK